MLLLLNYGAWVGVAFAEVWWGVIAFATTSVTNLGLLRLAIVIASTKLVWGVWHRYYTSASSKKLSVSSPAFNVFCLTVLFGCCSLNPGTPVIVSGIWWFLVFFLQEAWRAYIPNITVDLFGPNGLIAANHVMSITRMLATASLCLYATKKNLMRSGGEVDWNSLSMIVAKHLCAAGLLAYFIPYVASFFAEPIMCDEDAELAEGAVEGKDGDGETFIDPPLPEDDPLMKNWFDYRPSIAENLI